MADFDELKRVRIFYLKTPGGGMHAEFVIDGRQYSNPQEVRADISEAWQEMERRQLLVDVETRPIEANASPLALPTWQEYKRRLQKKTD